MVKLYFNAGGTNNVMKNGLTVILGFFKLIGGEN